MLTQKPCDRCESGFISVQAVIHFLREVDWHPEDSFDEIGLGDLLETARLWELLEQGLVDLACVRVRFLPLSDKDGQRFGIDNEWCTPEVSSELRAKLRLDEPETSSAFGTLAR